MIECEIHGFSESCAKCETEEALEKMRRIHSGDTSEASLTRYIISLALSLSQEQYGEDFARNIIREAGISHKNTTDLKIINEIGGDALELITRYNQ